jgi:DNA invertase Pin-like site-specific DNA recombinase
MTEPTTLENARVFKRMKMPLNTPVENRTFSPEYTRHWVLLMDAHGGFMLALAELKKAGAVRLFAEKKSGARADRPQLRKAIASLGTGDVLLVTRLDRLARSSRDLLNILHEVAECGAAFKSLAEAWADTTTPYGKLMITVLGGLYEFERSLIKARTDVGIQRAREAGIKFGRPSALTKHQQEQALQWLDEGKLQSEVALTLDVGQATISRLWARHQQKKIAA